MKYDYNQTFAQVHELDAGALNLRVGDTVGLHALIQRMKTLVGRVYGYDSPFIADLGFIQEGINSPNQDDALWEFNRKRFENMCSAIMEDLGISNSANTVNSPSPEANSSATMSKAQEHQRSISVFVSHSAKDELVAEALVELLRAALNLPPNRIRCTSVNGYRLPGGASIQGQLRREVHDSEAFIALVTKSSIDSKWVLFELGARWGIDRLLVPLLANGADSSLLQGPLAALNALSCDDESQVHQLIDELATRLFITNKSSPASYQKHLERLLSASKDAVTKHQPGESNSVRQPRGPIEALDETEERVMKLFVANPGEAKTAADLSRNAGLSELHLRDAVNRLVKRELLHKQLNMGKPAAYRLTESGTAYLVSKP